MRNMVAVSAFELDKKLYQRSVWDDVTSLAANRPSPRPIVVELDPTSFCDLACPECISEPVLNSGGFTRTRLLEIAHELVGIGVRAVILIGGGEPLLHPAVSEVMETLHTGGVQLG